MVEQHFFGSTNTGKDRLNTSLLTPLGGKFGGKYSIVIDFNANDAETPDLRNRGIEVQMVDGFELLYRADLSVSDATISARFPVKGFSSDGVVYTTRLTAEVADTIDWDRKAEIDFTALWEVVFQHPEFQ